VSGSRTLLPASKELGEGRDAAPSLAHLSPKPRCKGLQTPDHLFKLSLPQLCFGQSRLTIPNTCSTITVSASLRSDCCSPSLRNAVRLPSGIDVHLHRNTQLRLSGSAQPELCERSSSTDLFSASERRHPAATWVTGSRSGSSRSYLGTPPHPPVRGLRFRPASRRSGVREDC
jgi:hypothetical protein